MKHHFHPHLGAHSRRQPDLAEAEALLSAHFGAHCVLTSSGRAAIHLALGGFGLSRYVHEIAAPRFISRCVMDVVVRHGFPSLAERPGPWQAALRYHQYGIPQSERSRPSLESVRVVDDLCHAFFWPDARGGVGWAGEAAVFSMPKFFPASAMSGGVLVRDGDAADRLRAARDATAPFDDSEQAAQSAAFLEGYDGDPQAAMQIERLYLERMIRCRPHRRDLIGFPCDLAEIAAISERRRQIAQRLLAAAPVAACNAEWRDDIAGWRPFALPVFVEDAHARRSLVERARALGFDAGVFSCDVARNQFAPDYRPVVFLPCHHLIADADVDALADLLRKVRNAAEV